MCLAFSQGKHVVNSYIIHIIYPRDIKCILTENQCSELFEKRITLNQLAYPDHLLSDYNIYVPKSFGLDWSNNSASSWDLGYAHLLQYIFTFFRVNKWSLAKNVNLGISFFWFPKSQFQFCSSYTHTWRFQKK